MNLFQLSQKIICMKMFQKLMLRTVVNCMIRVKKNGDQEIW